MIEKLIQSWRGLARREQRVVAAAAVVLTLAVGYLLLFEPAFQGIRQASRDLPVLRSEVAQLDALSAEARRLGALPDGQRSPQATRQALEGSIDAAGLRGQLAELKLSGEIFDLRFKEVPFGAWLEWMDAALRETRLRVIDAAVQREAQPGKVSVRLSLELPRQQSK